MCVGGSGETGLLLEIVGGYLWDPRKHPLRLPCPPAGPAGGFPLGVPSCSCPCCTQVFVLALTFLILFLGNFLTTLRVVHAKLQKNKGKVKTT